MPFFCSSWALITGLAGKDNTEINATVVTVGTGCRLRRGSRGYITESSKLKIFRVFAREQAQWGLAHKYMFQPCESSEVLGFKIIIIQKKKEIL